MITMSIIPMSHVVPAHKENELFSVPLHVSCEHSGLLYFMNNNISFFDLYSEPVLFSIYFKQGRQEVFHLVTKDDPIHHIEQ